MLQKLQNDIFIIALLVAGFIGCWLYVTAYDLMAIGTLLAFLSQMALLLFFSKDDGRHYPEGTLFLVVFAYSLMLGALFMGISEYFSGDTFMFSKSDAMRYYDGSMRAHSVGFFENVKDIMQRKAFEDWGSYFYDSLLMSIYPSKFFLNLSYMLTGAISSVLLFRIGRHYMPEQYAYVAAMAYGTSSFLITFHCTFLKESLFVFVVICAVYNMCRGLHKESNNAYPYALLFLFVLFFFRPAVAAFVILSFSVYIAVKQHGSAFSLFFYMVIAVGFLVSLKFMMDMTERYSNGYEAKAEASGNAQAYSGGFNLFVNIFGGFFGPFPTLFTKHETGPSTVIFYSSGLTYRLFYIFPFLGGIYLIFKNKVLELLPVTIFILMEMLATGMVAASLELRKVMPHIPFTFVISFYGLSQWQESKVLRRIPSALFITVAVGILLMWNVIKAK